MTDHDLDRIERDLGVRLPADYRRVMAEQGAILRGLTYRQDGREIPFFGDDLWLDADELVGANRSEREPGMGTAYAFPRWWQTFFLFATNGGGDYYALRLDDGPGVWMIGSDCGSEPTRTHGSLEEYVGDRLAAYVPERTSPPPPPPPPPFDDSFPPEERAWHAGWKYPVPPPERRALAPVLAAPDDDAPRLAFADWLAKQKQAARAEFVRARVALDGKPPLPDAYPDAVERLREAEREATPHRPELPPGLAFFSSEHDLAEWWSDASDAFERGLPSFAQVDPAAGEEDDANATARRVMRALPALVEKTPIRGLDFEWHVPRHVRAILAEPAAAALTRVAIDSRPEADEVCPAVAGLVGSPAARNLSRLAIEPRNDATVRALADAPFDRLRRYDAHFLGGSPESARQLLAAPWFRRLHRLMIGLPGDGSVAEGLAGMPDLHTLCLWFPKPATFREVGGAEFPALRRLFVHAADLRGGAAGALATLRGPGLVELWLRNSAVRVEDLRALLAAPWAERLQVLTVECKLPDSDSLNVVADSPCAAHLRILRFHWNGFPRLAGTGFARPGAFPRLTSLEFAHPFNPDDPSIGPDAPVKDTAAFLRTLHAPALRFLRLKGCGYNARCRDALTANDTLKNVARLETD